MASQKTVNTAIRFHYLLEMENGQIKTSLTKGALEYQPKFNIIVTYDGSEWRQQISAEVFRMVTELEQTGDYLFEDNAYGRLWVRKFAIGDDCLTTDDKIKRNLSNVKKETRNKRSAMLYALKWWMTDDSLVQLWEYRQQRA
ncbi:hypothetical protein IFR04_012168 [Cadophora malorum]|uniref:Uncharacterized protein n=1 Tax=Cadophora malorum TaxID=108018 RepID=A0A8H7W1T9_9HELO|nr:hypothetical protein IFR04_012168 [Cadophora malorum]